MAGSIAIDEMMRRNQATVADRNKAAGKAFREELAKKQGVKSCQMEFYMK